MEKVGAVHSGTHFPLASPFRSHNHGLNTWSSSPPALSGSRCVLRPPLCGADLTDRFKWCV